MIHAQKVARRRAGVHEALRSILEGDLDFHGSDGAYASHALHAFAAKFPPQLPHTFIERLTAPGDTVLDPMMGSGTAILEASLLGRRAVGFDIDPLAVRLCRVKTTPLSSARALRSVDSATARAAMLLMLPSMLADEIRERFDAATRRFIDYWFLPQTQHELMALVMAIEEGERSLQDFLRLVFSSVIITKSGGVSQARDLAHTRPHRVQSKVPRSALGQFALKGRKAAAALGGLPPRLADVSVSLGDARSIPLPDCSVDLIITSPPYANAIDYMRAHKFSLVWFGEPIEHLTALRATYVGSENCKGLEDQGLPPLSGATVNAVAARDMRKARVLAKYLGDMRLIMSEMHRVLRAGAAAGIVVGPSTMRGVRVPTHEHLAEIAGSQLNFEVVGIGERRLDRDKRMMPARNEGGRMNGIGERMHQEFIVGLVKPRARER